MLINENDCNLNEMKNKRMCDGLNLFFTLAIEKIW
jgi:hypothetical protein